MYRFLTLTKAMFLIHVRDKSLLFWNFAFPVMLIVINGAAFGSGNRFPGARGRRDRLERGPRSALFPARIEVAVDELREMNLGLWEGMLAEDFEKRYPRACQKWLDDPASVVAPEGDCLEDVRERVLTAVRREVERQRRVGAVGLVLRPFVWGIVHCWLRSCSLCEFWAEAKEAGPRTPRIRLPPAHKGRPQRRRKWQKKKRRSRCVLRLSRPVQASASAVLGPVAQLLRSRVRSSLLLRRAGFRACNAFRKTLRTRHRRCLPFSRQAVSRTLR